jgi:nucleoid DNA-binding protein
MIKMAEGREVIHTLFHLLFMNNHYFFVYFYKYVLQVVTKTELINQLKEKTGFTKAGIDTLLAAFADTVREEVLQHGKEIRIRDFGTFKLREIAPRKGRNPKTGEELDICASKSVIFSASSNLKFKEANEDEEE